MVGVQGVSGIDNQLVSAYAICYPLRIKEDSLIKGCWGLWGT